MMIVIQCDYCACYTDGNPIVVEGGKGGKDEGEGGGWDVGDEDLEIPLDVVCTHAVKFIDLLLYCIVIYLIIQSFISHSR